MTPVTRWRWGSILLFLAGILAISLYFVLLFVPGEREEMIRSLEVQLLDRLRDRKEAVEAWLADGLADARLVAASVPAPAGNDDGGAPAPRASPHLGHVVEGGRYCSAALYDAEGTLRTASFARGEGDCIAPPQTAREAARAGRSTARVVKSEEGGTFVSFSAPLEQDGGAGGTVSLNARIDRFLRPATVAPAGTQVGIFLARLDDRAPATSGGAPEDVLLLPLPEDGAAPAESRVTRFRLVRGEQESSVLAATEPLLDEGWYLVATLDERQALAVFRRHMSRLGTAFGILAAALLFMALGYLWTQRRAYEGLLALSEARETARMSELATTLDLVPAAVLVARDRECINVVGNRAAHEMLRVKPEGKILPDPEQPAADRPYKVLQQGRELSPERFPLVRAARDGNEIRGVPIEMIFRDGTVRHIVGDAAPLHDGEGETRGAVAAFLDVTAMKDADEALQRSLSLLESTLESTDDALLVVDLRGRPVLHNHRLIDLLKIPSYVLAEPGSRRLFPFIARRTTDPAAFDMLVASDAPNYEGQSAGEALLISGETLEIAVRPQRIGERVVGRVWTFRDVTQRRRAQQTIQMAEQQIHQSQKLDAVGRLAGGVAHDLNNVLSVVLGYSDLLRKQFNGSPDLSEKVDAIREAADRAARLTTQLLTFSRRRSLMPSIVDPNDVMKSMHAMLRSLMGDAVRVETYLATDLWCVMADRGQIEQVIMNLAVNARDAMPEGGSLMIATANVELADETAQWYDLAPGRYVRMTLQDTGQGMTPEVRSKVFDPFFTTKGPGEGTGLGLATVYGVVTQSGGAVTVDSEVGKGTVFQILLPAVEAKAEPMAAGEAPSTLEGGDETILLVEDDEAVRALAVTVLEEAGYRVLEASGAAEAESFANEEEGTIHLLLTDVVMPELPGPKLARRLREVRPDLKVVFMSGYADGAESGITVEAGAPFLQKPFAPSALTRKVREVLEH